MRLVWQDGIDFTSSQKYIILLTEPARLSAYFFHINTKLESNTSPQELLWYKLQIFSVFIIIWNLSVFRRLYGWGPLILSCHPAKFWLIGLVKVEICFSFATWPRGRCVMWICRWGPLILSHHLATFGVHRPCESGYLTFLIYHMTTWLMCTWRLGEVSSS